jgi:hypothetical protein
MSAKAVDNYQPFASTRKTIPETFPAVTVRQISAKQVKLTSPLGSSRAIVGELVGRDKISRSSLTVKEQ